MFGVRGAGSGGSGYVLTSDSYKPPGYLVNNPDFYFSYPELIDGDNLMPLPNKSFSKENEMDGNKGNGLVRITILHQTNSPISFVCMKNTAFNVLLICTSQIIISYK